MNKKIIVVTAVVVSCLIFSSKILNAKEIKIGVVDVEKIYSEYEKAKKVREEIQTKRIEKQVELSKKQEELKKLQDEYNSKKDKMKDAEKKNYEDKINSLRTEINNFVRTINQQLLQETRNKTKGLLNEIAKVIQDYAKENNYDFIVDKKSLPYFSSGYDISAAIIKRLNSQTK